MNKTSRIAVLALVFCVLLSLAFPANAAVIDPTSKFYIADYSQSDVISEETEEYIVAMNRQLEAETGAQIVVAVVDFIDGADIENYTFELYNSWKIGSAELNNGLLILLVIGEQNYWGVQGAGIRDVLSASLIADTFNNYLEQDFAAAHYDSGVRSVFDAFLDWYSQYYSVTLTVPEEYELTDDLSLVPDFPVAQTEETEEDEDTQGRTDAILAAGFMLGKIAKWFLVSIAAAAVLVFLFFIFLRRRRLGKGAKRVGIFSSAFRRRNKNRGAAVPPPQEPVNRYNSLYRNTQPNGQYHYVRPANGTTRVNTGYRSGYSAKYHNIRKNSQPPKNKYDNLYRFNSRPAGTNTSASGFNRPSGMNRPSGFGFSTRPSGTRPSASRTRSNSSSGTFGTGFTRGGGSRRSGFTSRPSGTRSTVSRSAGSVHRSGGGGFTRGGGGGRR